MCCRVARVSREAFYDWSAACAAGPTHRGRAEAALAEEIRGIHAGSDGTYGSPRAAAAPADRGHRVNHQRVERLMRAHDVAGVRPRRPERTTTPACRKPKLADLVGRDFSTSADNAAVEAFFSSLKRELVNRRRCPDQATDQERQAGEVAVRTVS